MKPTKSVIPSEILSQHIAILGKTRSGKSSVMRGLVERLIEDGKPVCIVDPKGDWWGIKLAKDGKHEGYPVVIFGGEHADIPIDEHSGHLVAELFATGNRPCLIDLGGWMVGPRTRFWIDFASTLFKLTKGSRWLAVDEIHNFAPKGKVFDADAGKALHWTNRLASEGLGKGLQMIFASQRPQKVHNDTLTSAETLIAMRVIHPSDRGAVSDWIKGCGDSEGNEVLTSLAQMDRGEGWAWSPEIGFGPQRTKFPMFETYDSFRAQTVEDTNRLTGWAEVDLEEIRQKFAATIEKVKADDPKELRKEILSLKKEIVALKQGQSEVKPERVEVSVLTDADRELLKAAEGTAEFFETWSRDVKDLLRVVQQKLSTRPAHETRRPISERPVTPHIPVAPAHKSRPVEHTNAASSTDLGKCERAILQVLSQFSDGCESGRLTLLAGYTFSGSFSNALGRLRTLGFIEGQNTSVMRITNAGLSCGPFQELPRGRELIEYWLRHPSFGKCERMILKELTDHPKGLTAEQLCDRTGYSFSGSFSNALGKLRTAGVLVGKNTEVMRASETLFE